MSKKRPEWVRCVLIDESGGKPRLTYCGRDISRLEWSFLGIEHAHGAIENGSRLVPCVACMKEWAKS